MKDQYGRTIDYLRISVTDRCNLRCIYCMPEAGVEWIPHEDILTFEEIVRLCRLFAFLGIRRIKLTGGEPLVRHGILSLVRELSSIPGIEQITMTTNGVLFAPMAEKLAKAGLSAATISLDTLRQERYAEITRFDFLKETEAAMKMALSLGLSIKLNCVPLRGVNEDELPALAALAKDEPLSVRFIELMPMGCARAYTPVPSDEVKKRLEAVYGASLPFQGRIGNGPAEYVTFPGFRGHIGFISALSQPFCSQCNRIRLTASGYLKLCLHHPDGVELLPELRSGKSDEELLCLLASAVFRKPRQHHFEESLNAGNDRMNQIGG